MFKIPLFIILNIKQNPIKFSDGLNYKELVRTIDTTFNNTFKECYSTFCAITQPIESSVKVKEIIIKMSLSKRTTMFQSQVVKRWNPLHHDNIIKLIVPPVSLHDQIRSDRYGITLIELLKTVGLLVKETNIYNTTKVMNQELSDNWKKHRSFYNKLIKLPLYFSNTFRQSQIFHKALSRVVEISGPLHMVYTNCYYGHKCSHYIFKYK